MKITYSKVGEYYLPNLKLPDEEQYHIGKYGFMREAYLKEHRPGLYSTLLLQGKLNRHLAEIDETCHNAMERIVADMAKREGVTEELKAANQMAWVQKMSNIHSRAEETVLHDFVYEG